MDTAELKRPWLAALVIVLWAGLTLPPAQAQSSAELSLDSPVTGQISSGAIMSWTLAGREGEALSLKVEAGSDGLDPALAVSDSSGNPLIANDDYNYPTSRDALLEAITLPRTDTYTITVSAFGATTGRFTLTALPGFAQTAISENFDGASTWQAASAPLQVNGDGGQLNLSLSGAQQTGIARNPAADSLSDFYARIHVTTISGQSGWQVGMAARQKGDGSYYLFMVNDQGQWRFIVHTPGGDQALREWTAHPAIVAGQTDFTLGLMASGDGFDFFYNDQLIGRVSDPTLTGVGQFGLAVGTVNAADAQTTASFDDLMVTVPLQIDGKDIVPQQLILGTPSAAVIELERRRLIPASGDVTLTVPQSSVQSGKPGVSLLTLGRGATYTNFALGATATWQTSGPGAAGCGLAFRITDDTDYTLAYLDQTGGYGVSQRRGDQFQPGIFGQNPDWATDANGLLVGAHRLLVIANANTLYYYVDGQYTGTLDNPPQEGAIANAVVNFEALSTACSFTDTWLYNWN